jgi:hypothetical protein
MGDGIYDNPPRASLLDPGGSRFRFRLNPLLAAPRLHLDPALMLGLHLPSLAPAATDAPAAATTAPAATTDTPAATADEPDAPQMFMPVLGLTNAAWMAQHPLYTLTTEFTGLAPFLSATSPMAGRTFRPSLQIGVRDRLGQHVEAGVFGGFGGTFAFRSGAPTGTGNLGLSLHVGPDQPSGTEVGYGTALWLNLYQAWGAEPPRTSPPPGWSFNPSANAMVSHSWMRPDRWGADLVWGAGFSRWGAVNDVTSADVLSPFIGFNYARNVGKHDALNWEFTFGSNIGLGGRADGVTGGPTPFSLALNVGLFGWQHTWGDYGFGLEPWFFTEFGANVANPGAPPFNLGGGLRLDFGAINPRREHVFDDDWPLR